MTKYKLIERVRKYDDYLANANIQDLDTLRPMPLSQINFHRSMRSSRVPHIHKTRVGEL